MQALADSINHPQLAAVKNNPRLQDRQVCHCPGSRGSIAGRAHHEGRNQCSLRRAHQALPR